MELYEIGSRLYSCEDLNDIRIDLGTFTSQVMKAGGTFEKADGNHDGFLTIPELDEFVRKGTSPEETKQADVLRRSIEPLSEVKWDFVLWGPQVSKDDVKELTMELLKATERIQRSERLAEVVKAHFPKIRDCYHQAGLGADEISSVQINRYLETAQLTDSERADIKSIFKTMWTGSTLRSIDVDRYSHAIRRQQQSILDSSLATWKNLPDKSYVPERWAKSPLIIGLEILVDVARSKDKTPAPELVERAARMLDAKVDRPRLVPRALEDLGMAAAMDASLAKTDRFQKIAAMAGAAYDPWFMKEMKKAGVGDQVRKYFDQYKKSGVGTDAAEIRSKNR